MTALTRNDWKLIGIGVAVGVLAGPVLQLFRMMTTRVVRYNGEGQADEGSGRTAGNIINICIMGAMATTRVNKVFPAAAPAVKKVEAPSTEQHYSSLSDENWRL